MILLRIEKLSRGVYSYLRDGSVNLNGCSELGRRELLIAKKIYTFVNWLGSPLRVDRIQAAYCISLFVFWSRSRSHLSLRLRETFLRIDEYLAPSAMLQLEVKFGPAIGNVG